MMQKRTGLGNALPIAAGLLLLWFGGGANAMNFTLTRDQLTVRASGPISPFLSAGCATARRRADQVHSLPSSSHPSLRLSGAIIYSPPRSTGHKLFAAAYQLPRLTL